ncbi:hypothetical protein [Candidatus Formimonas warabiya]|uniref:Uncharacterized protein n=1 Tax=Formimonas warabiya TaxID=1761012 RepID=A0A3G1KR51_FORW1|nr:hypothetical protein [Candidatus Formimonas warabiya]ATW24585.1 hypothetical protein DCMF_07115 [Candidatus Formimonas warabiya]
MKLTLWGLLFQGIPECIALVTLVFVIAKARIDWKKIVLLGVLIGCVFYVLRMLPITFGIHTIVGIGLLIFLLTFLEKIDLVRAIIAVLLGNAFLILAETVCFWGINVIFHLPWDEISNNQFLMTLTGIPQILLIFLAAFVVKRLLR